MRLHHLALLLLLFVPSCSFSGGAPARLAVQRPAATAIAPVPLKKCAERKNAAQPVGRAASGSGRPGESVSAS